MRLGWALEMKGRPVERFGDGKGTRRLREKSILDAQPLKGRMISKGLRYR